jgi:hypothetical protein
MDIWLKDSEDLTLCHCCIFILISCSSGLSHQEKLRGYSNIQFLSLGIVKVHMILLRDINCVDNGLVGPERRLTDRHDPTPIMIHCLY